MRTRNRDAITGEYVDAQYAKDNPDTTVTERRVDLGKALGRLEDDVLTLRAKIAMLKARIKLLEEDNQ